MRKIFITFFFFMAIGAQAATIPDHKVDINVLLVRSRFNIQENEIPVFTLNNDTGEVIFGDGVPGDKLPSGTQNIVGTYRTGNGNNGDVLHTYIIPQNGSPTFIPFSAFPIDASGKPVLCFIVSGVDFITVKISDEGVEMTNVEFTKTLPVSSPANNDGGDCFIASAAFGSSMECHVQKLRDFRDRYLLKYVLGRKLVNLYYRTSPQLAQTISKSSTLRPLTRWLLMPIIGIAFMILNFGIMTTSLIMTIAVSILISFVILFRSHIVQKFLP